MRNRDPRGEVLCPRSARESVQSKTNTWVSWLWLNCFSVLHSLRPQWYQFTRWYAAYLFVSVIVFYLYNPIRAWSLSTWYMVGTQKILVSWVDGMVNRQTDRWVDGWTTWGRMVQWKAHRFWSHVDLGLNPSPATYWLCNVKQVIQPLWVSDNSLVKWQWRVSES